MTFLIHTTNKTRKKSYFLIYVIILNLLIYHYLNINEIFLMSPQKEIENIELYLKLCKNKENALFDFSNKIKNPKVSIISPIYNRGKYLLRFLKSIQYQNFNEVEILLIDDYSTDNTINLIKYYQNIDHRIILIKNKKNSGTFKCRIIGILASKGEYAIIPDPDDILSQNSLTMFYAFATKYNYEMIRFNLYLGNDQIFLSDVIKKIKSRPIFQPELRTFLFYATGILMYIDFNVSNKFIKREALIRAVNLLDKEYLNNYMIHCEDQLLNYILYKTVKSFYFLKRIGYYYIINSFSITSKQFNSRKLKNIMTHLKVLFVYSKNNQFEKNMFNYLFKDYIRLKSRLDNVDLLKDDIKFYKDTLDLFLENDFVSINNRNYMIQIEQRLKNIT